MQLFNLIDWPENCKILYTICGSYFRSTQSTVEEVQPIDQHRSKVIYRESTGDRKHCLRGIIMAVSMVLLILVNINFHLNWSVEANLSKKKTQSQKMKQCETAFSVNFCPFPNLLQKVLLRLLHSKKQGQTIVEKDSVCNWCKNKL